MQSLTPTQCSSKRSVKEHGCLRKVSISAGSKTPSEQTTRRDILATGAVLASLVGSTQPTFAAGLFNLLGDPAEEYVTETNAAIAECRAVLAIERDDPNKEDAVKRYKNVAQEWVGKWRTYEEFQRRYSYLNMYSVLNSISGHYNSFGPTAPIPKKRLEVMNNELNDAEKFLNKGR